MNFKNIRYMIFFLNHQLPELKKKSYRYMNFKNYINFKRNINLHEFSKYQLHELKKNHRIHEFFFIHQLMKFF